MTIKFYNILKSDYEYFFITKDLYSFMAKNQILIKNKT